MARSIKLERAIFICAIRPYPPKTYCAQTQILYKHVYYCRLYVAIVQIIAEHNIVGEVAEWSKAAHHGNMINYKSACALYCTNVQIIAEHNTVGEVAEWSKAHAWKACRRFSRLVGSNPILSSSLFNIKIYQ